MTDPLTHYWSASDGVKLVWHEMGQGRPVVLLHGLFSSAHVNWIKFGHADKLAAKGLRVIMPDLRAHGQSAAPHDPANYPDGILGASREGVVTILNAQGAALLGVDVEDAKGLPLSDVLPDAFGPDDLPSRGVPA